MTHRLYLTGFMGAGKTTVGKMLAEALQYDVIDMDEWIEKKEGKQIKEIFSTRGEPYFRKLETKALKEIGGSHVIVTTGGGVVMKEENRNFMKQNGTVIYLQCELDEIFKRLAGDESRPNFTGERREIAALFAKRKPLYEEATMTVNTTGKTVETVVHEIVNRLNQ